MLSLFKRLNKTGVVGLACVGAGIFLSVPACKKRERLAASTFNFAVRPPAITVVKGQSVTLTALSGAASDVSPTWTLSPGTAGSITPAIGRNVVFTASALGDAVVTAVQDGLSSTSQIAVVTYQPTANTFDVYTDELPTDTALAPDIFLSGVTLEQSQTGYTPQGTTYLHITDADTNDFVSITLDKNSAGITKDLSSFSTGSLKFSLRLGRSFFAVATERFRIDLTGPNGTTRPYTLVRGTDFSTLSTDWQEITIPISSFPGGLDFAHIEVPFSIVPIGLGSSTSFDLDAIRWER